MTYINIHVNQYIFRIPSAAFILFHQEAKEPLVTLEIRDADGFWFFDKTQVVLPWRLGSGYYLYPPVMQHTNFLNPFNLSFPFGQRPRRGR